MSLEHQKICKQIKTELARMLLSYRSSREALAEVNEKFQNISEVSKTLDELKGSFEDIKKEYRVEEENFHRQERQVKEIRDEIEKL